MKLYLRGNVWWARWTEAGTKHRRSCKTTHRDEAAAVVAGWGRKVDQINALDHHGLRTVGLVYFVLARGTDRIKIGFTQRPIAERLKGIQTGCPYPIEVVSALRASRMEEHHYHQIFARDRVIPTAEWFVTSPDVMHAAQIAKLGSSVCPRCTGR